MRTDQIPGRASFVKPSEEALAESKKLIRVGKIAWHWDDGCERLRNFAHASTPRSSRVGKIAQRRPT